MDITARYCRVEKECIAIMKKSSLKQSKRKMNVIDNYYTITLIKYHTLLSGYYQSHCLVYSTHWTDKKII